ncbi:MAG: hypothetical protein HMLKMBBP_02241 [Planctomycetes bacterium]|nr:hypothetical protein [Planctomycetota bacterium]
MGGSGRLRYVDGVLTVEEYPDRIRDLEESLRGVNTMIQVTLILGTAAQVGTLLQNLLARIPPGGPGYAILVASGAGQGASLGVGAVAVPAASVSVVPLWNSLLATMGFAFAMSNQAPGGSGSSGSSGSGSSGSSGGSGSNRSWGDAANPNKLHHVFDEPGHKLGPLLDRFGSKEAAAEALKSAAQMLVDKQGITGVFERVVRVGGIDVTVRGKVIDGVARIGTAFVP